MTDNAAIVCVAVLTACVLGGFTKGCIDSNRDDAVTEQIRQRGVTETRNRCISAGNAWINDNCIPRCVP